MKRPTDAQFVTLAEFAGASLVSAGCLLFAVPIGLIVAGAFFLLFAVAAQLNSK